MCVKIREMMETDIKGKKQNDYKFKERETKINNLGQEGYFD